VAQAADQGREQEAGHHIADPQDQQVEQALGAGADVLGEHRVDEDIDRGEEEGVADPVQQLHRHDHRDAVGEEGEDRETGGVAQHADDHGDLPSQSRQHAAQQEHGQDLGHLAQAQHHHAEIAGDPHPVGQEGVCHHEVAVVDH
jgi:hypothetical protein